MLNWQKNKHLVIFLLYIDYGLLLLFWFKINVRKVGVSTKAVCRFFKGTFDVYYFNEILREDLKNNSINY